ncbi:MAG: type VI secretion system protein TssA [Planctomycetaceae bacterium]
MSVDIDITSLLEPFEGEFRGGTDLRADDDPGNDYRRIRDSRNEAREFERRADDNGEPTSDANRSWQNVWDEGQEYLKTCGKDLEIVAYMIEASVRLYGYDGLTAALKLTHDLVADFWGELLPTPDEDGIETTLLPISRLNGDAITYPLMRVPLTADTSVGQMVVWQYTQAKQLEGMDAEERERRVSSGAVTMEMFNRAVSETPTDFYRSLVASLTTAQTAVQELDRILEEKAGEEYAPNLSRFHDSLKEAHETLKLVAGDRIAAAEEAAEAEAEQGDDVADTDGSGQGGGGGGRMKGAIGSREEAFEVLEKVAMWFERHEPQSILPWEIRKAKRRGRMTPEELYKDLISDSSVRDKLFRDVGIETASGSDE